jgi:chaperonin GroES
MKPTKRSIKWLVEAPDNKNLASDLSKDELSAVAQDVLRSYDIDRANRADWDAQSGRALKLAKQILEKKSTPWEGAANVKYPLITVATIQFAARAYPEICKGQRVVKCQITGDDQKNMAAMPPMPGGPPAMPPTPQGPGMQQPGVPSPMAPPPGAMPAQPAAPGPPSGGGMMPGGPGMMAPPQGGMPQPGGPPQMGGQPPQAMPTMPVPESPKQQRANRIASHMNWQLTQEMNDWEADTDCMLHVLPVVGQCYKKTYFSAQDKHNISELVLPDDCVVSKGRSRDLKKARRITHRLWIYSNEAVEKMSAGTWLDIDLGTAPSTDSDTDAPHEFYEQHRWDDLDGDGYKEPYIVTVHKTTSQVVRVVARWVADGIEYGDRGRLVRILPDHYFTHFGFIPNPDGSINYLGFGQLLEAINASANTALNQLIDSGTLANAGGGFIGKGVRLRGGSWNFKPGEWKLVDAHGAALKENIVPLPAKEPSAVLFQLLGFLIQAGKEISSLQDILSGDAKLASNMPVGTIMALVEQGLKVFTGIYKRIYRSLSEEFKKMYTLNARFLEPKVSFYISGHPEQFVERSDYIQGDTIVMPVADPELSSDMQRVLKSQALKELSGRPGLNEVEMTRRLVRAVRPENVDDLLLTDGQISGKEPTPWKPPPPPQQILAQAKAQRMMQQAQESQVRLQMDMLKFKLELQELESKIGNVKADTMLKLAKTEDAGRSDYMEYYKVEMDQLAKEIESKVQGVKGAVDKFAGGGSPQEPTGMEPPMGPGGPTGPPPGMMPS